MHLQYGNNPIEIGRLQPTAYSLLLDRGYTSHEHLFEVGLIHMNGRLYDPLLRRFLNADEHIQDPYNTQNYNKYGYVYNNPLMYNDPSGEFVGFIFGAIKIISAIFSAVQIVKSIDALVTGTIDAFQFVKGLFFMAVSKIASVGLGDVFKAGGFWETVGNGALAGAGGGGVQALMNNENFFKGLVKGAVIGGSIAAVSYGLGKLFEGGDKVNEVKREDMMNSVSSSDKAQKYSYGTLKEFEKGYGGLGNYGVKKYYLKNPNGYAVAKDGAFYRQNFWDKIGVNGQRVSGDVLGVTIKSDIYISKYAFSSKALLTEVITHETGHVILNNSNLSSLANTAFKGSGRFGSFFDNLGHISIRKMSLELFKHNSWLQPTNWMQVIRSWEIPQSHSGLDKLLQPLVKSFKF